MEQLLLTSTHKVPFADKIHIKILFVCILIAFAGCSRRLTGIDIEDFGSLAKGDVTRLNVATTAEWRDALTAITNGGNDKNYTITLTGDFDLDGSSDPTFGSIAGLTVSIRGMRTISLSSAGNLLHIGDDQTLILRDFTLKGLGDNSAMLVELEGSRSRLTLNAGATITGNTVGVNVRSGSFTMNDGEISGNTIVGVGLVDNGTFIMNGGGISNNTGGGVAVGTSGTFIMNDGEISGNTDDTYRGGGVIISGSFTMNSGKIFGNTSDYGGGAHVFDGGHFTMNNGEISGNTASDEGGGVYVDINGTFTMSGGEISGNTASNNGGGVYVYADGSFNKTDGGVIYGATNSSNANIVKNDDTGIPVNTEGHAVYYFYNWDNQYYRDVTLGENNDISTDALPNWTKK